ncbi:hypothetical protein LshimejAT787_0306930 [Lyophyllum shimeji]|uniref:Uncharacterized protein n=1 Tax=Lyophyllum shimeji TaxID=47721 RepID=A0A9P3PHV0_LYOSH|nr:hypothetical protein LshimejAT787_0306930 [Lyophyllum shimeji]
MKSLGYRLCHVNEKNEDEFRLRANLCDGLAMSDGSACPACQGISVTVQRLANWSQSRDRFTNRKYLSHEQLCRRLAEHDETLNNWKLKHGV